MMARTAPAESDTLRRRRPAADVLGMESIAEQLKRLNAPRILIRAAEDGKIKHLGCEMEVCRCPEELGGSNYFEPALVGSNPTRLAEIYDPADWTPTNDHYPTLKCDGGRKIPDNSRLAHRLCNRVDYLIRIDR